MVSPLRLAVTIFGGLIGRTPFPNLRCREDRTKCPRCSLESTREHLIILQSSRQARVANILSLGPAPRIKRSARTRPEQGGLDSTLLRINFHVEAVQNHK